MLRRIRNKKIFLILLLASGLLMQSVSIAASSNVSSSENSVKAAQCLSAEGVHTVGQEDQVAAATAPDSFVYESAAPVTAEESKGYEGSAAKLDREQSVVCELAVPKAGDYYIKYDYFDLTDGYNKSDLAIMVNGEYQSEDFERVPLEVWWTSENETFDVDRYGNEISPKQKIAGEWFEAFAYDADYKYENPLKVQLNAGKNEVKITLNKGEILLGNVSAVYTDANKDYAEYISKYAEEKLAAEPLILEAEKPAYKNNIAILPEAENNVNAQPHDTYKKLINVISGSSYASAGYSVSYAFTAEESGLYKLGVKYKQNQMKNLSVFRKISVDGTVPFAELEHYSFAYSDDFQIETLGNEDGDYLIYLEKGAHMLTLTADISPYAETIDELRSMNQTINQLYLDMKKLVGNTGDTNRDWTIEDYFPTIQQDLNAMADRLDERKAKVTEVNGAKTNNNVLASMQTASLMLRKLAEEPNEIPAQLSKLTEDSSSIAGAVTDAATQLESAPLTLDWIAVAGSENEITGKEKGIGTKFVNGVKQLAASFTTDYSGYEKEDSITVWVNRSTVLVNQLQKMTDTDFTKKTGIKVNYVQMPNESKITLSAMAGETPDAALGLSNWLPFELGTRSICADLTQFEDYNEVAQQFAPGSLIPFLVDGKAYAIPETQNAFVLYYRKDIMEELNLPIPQTWDEVIEILPELQRNGMNFYLPTSDTSGTKGLASTAPFIYQYGGSLYNETGTAAAFDSEQAITGLKRLTDFYTVYGLPSQVSSFYEKFSDGTIPIGLASFDVYVTLTSGSPELNGLWDIALSPGVKQEDGTITRWQSGGATSCMVFEASKKQEESWELLKWWMSTDVQTQFATTIKSLYGDSYIWNTSNLEAFKNVPMDTEHKQTILKQWDWLMEYPRIPGAYMTEREISNIWNHVVFDSANLRDEMDTATDNVNNEIVRKLNEFGYMDGNEIQKPFKVNTIDDIKQQINQ